MKQKEVAEKLGLSISGAKSRIQRGRIMLRKSITTCCHIELNRRNELVDGECLNPDCGCAQ
jgi:RNA polymerase sigma-70 factor (ECF subfamily)